MADSLVYVYAIGDVALAESDEVRALRGIEGQPVRTIVSGSLAAVASSVDAARFSEEALRSSFEDIRWLEGVARAHHAVVDTLARSYLVAPLRLVTLYLDDGNVMALLNEQADSLATTLEHLRGRTEWGVKAFVVHSHGGEDSRHTESSAGPGASYLMRRRAERDLAAREREQAENAAERVHRRISAFAVASRRYPPQDPRLSGYQDAMVLNAAYLVDDAAIATFQREIDGWDTTVLRLELTGPWAPYSFSTLDEQ